MPGRLRDPNDMHRLAAGIERARAVRLASSDAAGAVPAAESAAAAPAESAAPAAPAAASPTPPEPTAPEGDPLDGLTVLIPRSPERAAGLVALLEARGARTVVSPAITRAAVEDVAPVDDAVAALARGAFTWVTVTSVNAIDELVAAAARAGTDLTTAPTRWAAVGPATASALTGLGVEVALVPEESSARGLLAAFPAPDDALSPPRVLVPQGDLAAPRMVEGLAAAGYDPTVVTVYRTVSHALSAEAASMWRDGEVDVVVLTSGSVAREVASQLGAHGCVAGVAIGRPTARAAVEVDLRVDEIAPTADDAGLLAAIETVARASAADRRARAAARASAPAAALTPRRRSGGGPAGTAPTETGSTSTAPTTPGSPA